MSSNSIRNDEQENSFRETMIFLRSMPESLGVTSFLIKFDERICARGDLSHTVVTLFQILKKVIMRHCSVQILRDSC